MKIALNELATFVGGTLKNGDPTLEITGFASLNEAVPGDLSFFYDTRYNDRLLKTKASAVLVPADHSEPSPQAAYIVVSDPSKSFELIVETYGFQPAPFEAGVSLGDGERFTGHRDQLCAREGRVADGQGFVDDEEIGGERRGFIGHEAAAGGVVFEEPVNGGGETAGGLRETLRGATGGSGEVDADLFGF